MTDDLFSSPPQNLLPHDGIALNYGPIFDPAQSQQYLTLLHQKLPWQSDIIKMFGKTITTARKVIWMGDAGLAYTYSGITKEPLPWAKPVTELKAHIEELIDETFNSCLLNLYHHGEEGMSWHRDNEKSIVPHSPIACLSFGATRKFHFKHAETKERITTVLEPGSLLLMAEKIQTHWLHALPKSKKVTEPRISLTFRQMIVK